MPRLSRLALIGVAAVLSGLALAADLPPIPSLPEAESGPAEFSGWYLRGDVGGGVDMTAPKLKVASDPLSPGGAIETFNSATLSPFGMIDAGAGYQFNSSFRADATFEYRGGANLRSTSVAYPWLAPAQNADALHADVSSFVGLLNGYITPGAWYGFSPFLGAGIGLADNRMSGLSGQTSLGPVAYAGGSRTSFAWALMAGVDYDFTPNLKLELGYHYLNYGSITTGGANCGFAWSAYCGSASTISSRNRLASSDFRLGLIYFIGGPSPAVAAE